LNVFHGSTNAPTVDVVARGVGTLVDNAAYGDYTGYFSVPAASYTLDITLADTNTIVATFEADLSGLGGGTAVVFASGFLNPRPNNPAFGLFAALPDGNVLALTPVTTARLQVIHNAADPAAASVDIYLNGGMLLDNFGFREATSFIDAPANTPLQIGVAAGNSSSASDTLKNFDVRLVAGETYLAIANGVLAPNAYAANPDGRSIGFALYPYGMGQEESGDTTAVALNVFHGSTDAPAVDVLAYGVGTLVDNAAYGDYSGYFNVPAASYLLDITPAEDNTVTVATFAADLSTLGGGAAVVFASGFLAPDQNQDGSAFGLFAALPNGTVIELAGQTTARLKVIHNAADPGAASVDVYLNGIMLLDNFGFREATPFIDAPANTLLNIGVAAGSSTSAADTLKNFAVTLGAGRTYVAIANGVLNSDDFAANPDGRSTGLTLYTTDMALESAEAGKLAINVFHGSTDAPTVDVFARDVGKLVEDAGYGDFSGYFSVPAASYILDITPGNDNSTVVASFTANLATLDGRSVVVFASGFFTPDQNQNGAAFGLFAALANGEVIQLQATSTRVIEEEGAVVSDYGLEQNYPNPFNPTTTIAFTLPTSEFVTLTIYNALGQEVMVLLNRKFQAGRYQFQLDARDLTSGIYTYHLTAGDYTEIRRMTLLK
ncbi:DUF4397 domain-containing protein, partial [candidate division KSB1 bacterium]|nr:DUF4397 domain-containing protein [candidate division KSB1 bacterium]